MLSTVPSTGGLKKTILISGFKNPYKTIRETTLQGQFRLYIPFLGIARPQPQFPHSCVYERFIYSQDQSTYFLQRNRQTHRGNIRGASKIKVKNVNKKRTVTVRRLIIFLNISRRPLLICLQCCLHQYKTLKAVATATAAIVLLTPAKNLKKVFLGFLVVSPSFNNFLG
jgi:hypothetical protein